MAKDIDLSCPLCLNVYDPDDMLAVEIPHARFPQSEPAKFCRSCVIVFMKSAAASDLVDPREVFGSAMGDDQTDTAAAGAIDADTQSDDADGEDGERAPNKG